MLKVETTCMETQAQEMDRIARELEQIASRVASVNRNLRWSTSVNYSVRRSLSSSSSAVSSLDNKAKILSRVLVDAALSYASAENDALVSAGANPIPIFKRMDFDFPTLPKILPAFPLFLTSAIALPKIPLDEGYELFEYFYKGISTIDNYRRYSNLVGGKKAFASWFKNLADLSTKGKWSVASNPGTRFFNNLTNKTSPIVKNYKDSIDDLIGKNGIGNAAVKWGGIALDGVLNFFDNKDEQAKSGGTMSDGRVLNETVTETAVNTALTYTVGAAIGSAAVAGLAAVGVTVAAPGLLVTAIGGLAVAGGNALIESITGKSGTEWISDTIVDAGEAVADTAKKAAKSVGKAAKNAVKSVGKWFDKLSFA